MEKGGEVERLPLYYGKSRKYLQKVFTDNIYLSRKRGKKEEEGKKKKKGY